MYLVRVWVRAEGLAYECTCPVGIKRVFCKHTVAIALAHLEAERAAAIDHFGILREALIAIRPELLVDGLLDLARRDAEWSDSLKRMCLDALSRH